MQVLTIHNAQSVRELKMNLILFEPSAVFFFWKISNAVFLFIDSVKGIFEYLELDFLFFFFSELIF